METIGVENRAVSDLIWREDLYPRIEPDPATIQWNNPRESEMGK